jgi:hypothetical protein
VEDVEENYREMKVKMWWQKPVNLEKRECLIEEGKSLHRAVGPRNRFPELSTAMTLS